MASLSELRTVRIRKMELLKQSGMNPFSSRTKRTHTLAQIQADFRAMEHSQELVVVAGRVMAIRGQGAILFVEIFDGTARFQMVLKRDDMKQEKFDLFVEAIDLGDFVEFAGVAFTTQRGALSILISDWTILTKALLPLPDGWHGLTDDDERYRKRYLDILMDTDLRAMFDRKALFWSTMRNFLESQGFVEVQTPTLEVTTGGADARPFITHHNDYDIPVYLRISVGELWQKRLMAAGFSKTYEIGRAYRNEGSSPNHLQEFTNMEFYWAYADYRMGMELVCDMYRTIARTVYGRTQFSTRGHEFDLADEWRHIDYCAEILSQTQIDIMSASHEQLAARLDELSVEYDGTSRERMIDALWKFCRKNISGPAFVINYPDFMQPLAKRSQENPHLVEQFQVLIGGSEIGKGYSELNDPIDQRERFTHQQNLKDSGDEEAMMADWDFVEMLEHGMPPTCGFGAGDRLFAFLEDKPIRETVLFPLMRPKNE